MRKPLTKAAIIGLCVLLLAGCSVLRVSYNQGSTLAWWWLDGYVDFSAEQTAQARQAVQQWFAWHRGTQLPDYAELLARAGTQVMHETTPQQVCRWSDVLRKRVDWALHEALMLAAPLLPNLSTRQHEHVQRKFAAANDSFREDFLQPNQADRLAASVDRAKQRAEMLYGPLDAKQRQMLADAVAASPFDAPLWLGERLAMQAQMLEALHDVQGGSPPAVQARLGAFEARWRKPPPGYAAYQQRLSVYNCEVASRLHNSTSQAQRQHARERLRGWEDDLRALAAAAQGD